MNASASDKIVCETGFIQNGTCQEGYISKYKGIPCTDDSDCVLLRKNGSRAGYSECKCGINGGGYSYCALAEGDDEYRKVIHAYDFIQVGNIYCHTLLRFGPCQDEIEP